MLSIGEFSKLSGISKKALIWYDNIGLLKPDFTDSENGYRYYKKESIGKVLDLHFWKSMDFTINEISNISTNIINKNEKNNFPASQVGGIKNAKKS